MDLLSKVFISGGSGPVGMAIAETFHKDGHAPVLFQRHVYEDIPFEQVVLDVALDETAGIITDSVGKYGLPEHVVVAAGIAKNAPAMMLSEKNFADVVAVNLVGAYRFVKPLLRPMMQRGSGTITFISSVAAIAGSPGQANYAASKSGLSGLMKSLSRELGPYGIRVNSVLGGLLERGIADGLAVNARKAIADRTPLRREGTAEDVAACVKWLTSDLAGHVTGAEVPVSGGYEIG